MLRLRVMIPAMAALSVAFTLCSRGQALSAPTPGGSGQGIALRLGRSIQSLQSAMAALDPTTLHIPAHEKSALADGQASVARNLTQAMPGLLSAFSSAPENLGAAFRLYQDAEAVLAVAQRSADVLPAKDDDAGGADLRASATALSSDLDSLGSWIEVRGEAEYAARHAAAPAAGPSAAPAAPPPATLVINDANTTPAKKPAPAKKKVVPKIPHP